LTAEEAELITGLYDRHAAQYEKDRARSFPALFEKPWLDRFLAFVRPGGTVIDLGCGVGQPIARYVIEHGYSVTGVDSSPMMLRFCMGSFPGQTWIVGDMRQLSLGRQYDGILAWDSFFHLTPENQRAMFPVFANLAAPEAALMFTSGPRFGEAIGEYQGEPLYHASLDPDEYRALLSRAGFEVIAHTAEDQSCGRHTIWLARSV
jgi:SAM-dependent methyltransferase